MTIERLPTPEQARAWSEAARAAHGTLGFVPTMGALHQGHLTLVERARRENARVCVSVFVNPLQFDEPGDFRAYPRDLERDAQLLGRAGCHMVFGGTLAGFFPECDGERSIPKEDPGPFARGLEGAHRPGHFEGVATICRRLFEVVRPTRAYFGAKDFQQTLVVQEVAGRLGFPQIVVCATSREPDGLARSSRNERLSPEGRGRALALWRALSATRERWRAGERSRVALEGCLRGELGEVEVEYAVVRDPSRLTQAEERLERARALVAARVGQVRLIDNLRLDEAAGSGPHAGPEEPGRQRRARPGSRCGPQPEAKP